MSQYKHPLHTFCSQALQAGILPGLVAHSEGAKFHLNFTEEYVEVDSEGLSIGSHFDDVPVEVNTYLAMAAFLIERSMQILEDPERNSGKVVSTTLN